MPPVPRGSNHCYSLNESSPHSNTLTRIKSRPGAISRAHVVSRSRQHPPRPPTRLLTVTNDPKHDKRKVQSQQGYFLLIIAGFLCLLISFLLRTLIVLWMAQNPEQKPKATTKALGPSYLPHRLRSSHQPDISTHPAFISLSELEEAIQGNLISDTRLNPDLLVPLEPNQPPNPMLTEPQPKSNTPKFSMHGQFFRISRLRKERMAWEQEWDNLLQSDRSLFEGIKVDYTQNHHYEYPTKEYHPPLQGYPQLRSLKEIFELWPQDAIDHPPTPIRETLQHFDFATELGAAILYRERKLPFKLVHVPELIQANQKWTDDYISQQFDSHSSTAQGKCQESRHSFFAFFQPSGWNVERMGLPPTRNNDFTFHQWSNHARYADATQLDPHRPHFYWQAGVPQEERELSPSSWSFVSQDLPSFSSPNATFVCPDPAEQKGIQCRFGERGVTAATHFDAGKNMVGMIQGAKRYILHPPKECSKLGIVTSRNSALFRHSLLNFGHLNPSRTGLSLQEQDWLRRASTSQAVETVLKAGEILFIPSHWFHYIIGLQKNAQCNVRSGVDIEGDKEFGGAREVTESECDPRTR